MGGRTCGDRIRSAGDGSDDFSSAAEFVRAEFPDTCACRPNHQEVQLPTPSPNGTYADYLEPIPSGKPFCEQPVHNTECQLTCSRYEEDGNVTQVGSEYHTLYCKLSTTTYQCDEGWRGTRGQVKERGNWFWSSFLDQCCSCVHQRCGSELQFC